MDRSKCDNFLKVPQLADAEYKKPTREMCELQFTEPDLIGFYSVDKNLEKEQYYNDARNLMYFRKRQPETDSKIDLNIGFRDALPPKEQLFKLKHMLKWLKSRNEKHYIFKLLEKHPVGHSDITFVCFRGVLASLLLTPYEKDDGWFVCATRKGNYIFLCAYDTEEKLKEKEKETKKIRTFYYWGFKFEDYMFTKAPGGNIDLDNDRNTTKSEFCGVYYARIGNHKLIYGAEMDGVDSSDSLPSIEENEENISILRRTPFIETKTSSYFGRNNEIFKKKKLKKWWAQSYLVNTERIVCGLRDGKGIVVNVEEYNTFDLPKIADEYRWSTTECKFFLEKFLTFVKDNVQDKEEGTLWRFDWKPGADTGDKVTIEQISLPSEYEILTEEYLKCD